MTFRLFLWWMGSATLAAWLTWGSLLFFMDPVCTGFLGFFLFYLTLAIALIGTWTLLGTIVRVWRQKEILISRHVARSFRHSFHFTFLIIASLTLLSFRLWTWWLMMLLILFVSLMEVIYLSVHQQHPKEEERR